MKQPENEHKTPTTFTSILIGFQYVYHWSLGRHEAGRPTQFVPHAIEEMWNDRSSIRCFKR